MVIVCIIEHYQEGSSSRFLFVLRFPKKFQFGFSILSEAISLDVGNTGGSFARKGVFLKAKLFSLKLSESLFYFLSVDPEI